MTDIGKGTPVIFVGPDCEGWQSSGLTIDALYFVDEIDVCVNGPDCPGCGGTCISLRGRPGFWWWYGLDAFRPLGGDAKDEELEIEIPWGKSRLPMKEDA